MTSFYPKRTYKKKVSSALKIICKRENKPFKIRYVALKVDAKCFLFFMPKSSSLQSRESPLFNKPFGEVDTNLPSCNRIFKNTSTDFEVRDPKKISDHQLMHTGAPLGVDGTPGKKLGRLGYDK